MMLMITLYLDADYDLVSQCNLFVTESKERIIDMELSVFACQWLPICFNDIVYWIYPKYSNTLRPASVAQLDAPSDWRPGGRRFNPRRGRQHSFVEIDHEIFSTVILSLPLIQEGQLSVSGERMCTILVNRLED